MRDYGQQSENCNQWKKGGTLDMGAMGANKPRITDKYYASSIKEILIQNGSHLTVQRIFQNINWIENTWSTWKLNQKKRWFRKMEKVLGWFFD